MLRLAQPLVLLVQLQVEVVLGQCPASATGSEHPEPDLDRRAFLESKILQLENLKNTSVAGMFLTSC